MTYTYEQVDKAERDRLLAQLNAEKEDLKRKRYVLSLEFRDIANLLEDASSVNDLDLAFAQALALKCKVEDLLDEALEIKTGLFEVDVPVLLEMLKRAESERDLLKANLKSFDPCPIHGTHENRFCTQ